MLQFLQIEIVNKKYVFGNASILQKLPYIKKYTFLNSQKVFFQAIWKKEYIAKLQWKHKNHMMYIKIKRCFNVL